jgi:thiol-disulfide isomerase/thioredoxin
VRRRVPALALAALLGGLGAVVAAGCDKGASPPPEAAADPASRADSGPVAGVQEVAAAVPPEAPAAAPVAPPARISKGIGPQIGYTAPDFALKDLHGATDRLSNYRGRVVLLNFWATWCGPCRIEMPTIQALYEDLGGSDFQVLSVAADYEGADRVAPFVDEVRVTFPALLDDTGDVQDRYLVNALPTTFVLDRNGIVVYKLVGFFDWNLNQFRGLVEGLIREV